MTVVYIDKALPQRNSSLNDVHLYSLKKLLKHRMQEEIAHSFIPPQFILHNFNIQKQVNDKNITINKVDNSPKTPENTKTNDSDNCSTPKRQKLNPTEMESPESGTTNDSTKIYEYVTPIKQINKSPKLKSTIESPSKMLTRSASKKIDSSEGELNSPSPKRMTNVINKDNNETEEEKQLNIEENQPECIRNKKIKKKSIKSHNVNYRLWTLKIKDGENVMMKNFAEKREIKILVRSKIDGFEIGENGQITPTTIIPKLESQTLYGGEIATKSDLIRQWITLYFRPLSNLLRVRLNSRSSSYVKIENLNLNKITNECLKHHNFSPKDNIGVLYSVLANMIDLKPGNYVLRHTPKLGPFAALLKSVPENSQNDFNLYDFYEDTNCHVIATAKWVPIDTNCILSSHIRDNIMPGMFSPQNFGNKKNGVNKKWKNKKKKMRRKPPVHMRNGDTSE